MVDSKTQHYVFLVHGTWGRSVKAWYQKSDDPNSFFMQLEKHFTNSPLAGSIWKDDSEFEWKHGNSHEQRLEGAKILAERLRNLREKNGNVKFHFVAHSHGGNVVLSALEYYLKEPFHIISLWDPSLIEPPRMLEILKNVAIENNLFSQPSAKDESLTYEFQQLNKMINETNFISKILDKKSHKKNLENMRVRIIEMVRETLVSDIGSIVTLGTPFYTRKWPTSWFIKFFNNAFDFIVFYISAAIPVFAISILFLIIFVPDRILNAPGPLLWLFLPLPVWVSLVFAIRSFNEKPQKVDTNVYFNLSELEAYRGKIAFNALVIHANFLDEAYTGLSSGSIIRHFVSPTLERLFRPRPPEFTLFERKPDVHGLSTPGEWRQSFTNGFRLIVAFIKLPLYPILFLGYRIMYGFTQQFIKKASRPLVFGLPPDEFIGSGIDVKNCLMVDEIQSQEFDVSKNFAKLNIDLSDEENRFAFLWDDEELKNCMMRSMSHGVFGAIGNLDDQRQVLAIEERLKEALGVAGMRHSFYYNNEFVVKKIADFIKRNA